MIGVLSKDNETRAVEEFFQLFKTPWEFWTPCNNYDLIVATQEEIPQDVSASALVIYHSHAIGFDDQLGVVAESQGKCGWLEWQGVEFPVYGNLMAFHPNGRLLISCKRTSKVVGSEVAGSERPTVRIGFDLFREVAFLLSRGQPAENARFPTLDIHISLLRAIMVSMNIPFVEVPPVPPGYDFMACLTHDVDFVGVRDHKWDRTMWGFLYRATVGSLAKSLGGRLSWSKCLQNWTAALSLPFVHLGLRDDFWLEFDRYLEIERKFGSTFFFLPFKLDPGRLGSHSAPKSRAAKYDFSRMSEQVKYLLDNGCEVGLHGIDAWQDLHSAQSEQSRIQEVTNRPEMGTRMHWLYWDDETPEILEHAGFIYDSTFGYNDAIGFRAGTTQPFCPFGTEHMLELPLNIQDSAMFYSDRMMLTEYDALDSCRELIHTTFLSGGVLTVNWHTRSLSPERLWGDFYARLLKQIQTYRVWFGTADEVVEWFRKRRALRFDSVDFEQSGVRVALRTPDSGSEFSFAVKIYDTKIASDESGISFCFPVYIDNQQNNRRVLRISYCDYSINASVSLA